MWRVAVRPSCIMDSGFLKVNIQQLYVLPTLYLCVLYLSEKKLVPLTLYTDWFLNRDEKCLQRGTDWVFK